MSSFVFLVLRGTTFKFEHSRAIGCELAGYSLQIKELLKADVGFKLIPTVDVHGLDQNLVSLGTQTEFLHFLDTR